MIRIQYIALGAILFLALITASFRWPVDNGRITSTFGESRSDHFHDGFDMTCADDKIYPIKRGKLLFFWDKTIFPLENYPGGGNFKILDHGKGIYSVYMHLMDAGAINNEYTEKDVVGHVSNTGHSYGSHLHFNIINITENKSINPLILMPPVSDIKSPEITNMYLKIGDRYVMIKDKADIRLTQHYPLLIQINDSMTGSERIGVYNLEASFNNKKVLSCNFSSLRQTANGYVASNYLFSDIFDQKGYYKISGIKYREGENTLVVKASDYSGNSSEKIFTITVDLDIEN